MAALVGMNLTITQELHRMNDMKYGTLTKQIDDLNQEILESKKAEETQEEQNKELVEKRGNKKSQSQTQQS